MHVDFFYDFVCPYAYLAHLRIAALCEREGVTLVHRPILLGGVFRAIGAADQPTASDAPSKKAHAAKDLQRWSAKHGMPLRFPDGHPRRTVLALRATLASGEANVPAASRALFHATWADGLDLQDEAIVRAALDGAGLDGAALVAAAGEQEAKDALRTATDAAVQAGVFGVPTFIVHRERPGGGPSPASGPGSERAQLFWGQDRLLFVEKAIRGWHVDLPAVGGAPRDASPR